MCSGYDIVHVCGVIAVAKIAVPVHLNGLVINIQLLA